MFTRLRTANLSRSYPEFHPYRIRACRAAAWATVATVVVWAAANLVLTFVDGTAPSISLGYKAAAALILITAAAIALHWSKQGLAAPGGFLLASAYLLTAAVSIFLFPDQIFPLSLTLVFPILIAGAVIGGLMPFFFSALATALLLAVALISPWRPALPRLDAFSLAMLLLLYQGTAGLLYSLSKHIERTFERMRQQNEQMTTLAHTDPLTGLANRRHLIELLEREFARAKRYNRPLALLYLDLDGFKSINDRFGHLFGDEILRNAALSMRAVLRTTDMLARIGGDEFAVLLPETGVKGAAGVAAKLRKALEAFSNSLGGAVPTLTFCAGAAQMRPGDAGIDELLARADQAQYKAKAAGRGQIRTQMEVSQLPLFQEPSQPASEDA